MQSIIFIIHLLNAGALECHGGELLHFKKISTSQVVVPHRYAGIYACGLNIEKDPSLFQFIKVADDSAVEFLELAAHEGDPHVLYLEVHGRVRRIHFVM